MDAASSGTLPTRLDAEDLAALAEVYRLLLRWDQEARAQDERWIYGRSRRGKVKSMFTKLLLARTKDVEPKGRCRSWMQ